MFFKMFSGNWYDYGARFYDASLARFHTIDPLGEKFSHQSPFVYADNNPIRFIDYMGMNADGYTIDEENGEIEWVDDTGGETQDKLYTKKDYEKAKESGKTNSDGNPEPTKQVVVNDTDLLPQLESQANEVHWDGTPWGYDDIDGWMANTNNRSDAYNVFKFAAENSNVEWSYQRYTDGSCAVTTAGENGVTLTGLYHESHKNKTVAADVHSHPNATPSDLKPSERDKYLKNKYLSKNPNAKVQLYVPNHPDQSKKMIDITKYR